MLSASGRSAMDVWVSTFHSFCARLIRREATALGLPRDFAIYDDDDQNAAVKRALAQNELKPRTTLLAPSAPKSATRKITASPRTKWNPPPHRADDARKDVAKVFRSL